MQGRVQTRQCSELGPGLGNTLCIEDGKNVKMHEKIEKRRREEHNYTPTTLENGQVLRHT